MKTWEDILELLQTQKSDEIAEWIKRLAAVIKSIEKLLVGSTVAERRKYLFMIGFLKGIEIKLERLIKQGSGLQRTDEKGILDRVRWSNLLSAFNERIKTGVITNLKHVDVNLFLEDCLTLFREEIKSILKIEKTAVKVYAVLAAKFKVMKNDEEIVEVKHFNTKAEAIYPTTSIKN